MLSPAIIKKLSHKIDGEWSESYQITGVGTDTREDLSSKLFIPLIGDSFDGHDFLKQAIQKGAKAALWQEDYPRPGSVDPSFPLT